MANVLTDVLTKAQREDRAQRRVTRFVARFEPAYYELLCHAALPLVLTPELLSYLRNEFLREIDWIAEVDLLLSDLCSPVGYELYAMDTDVRAYLLKTRSATCNETRMVEVANLLISYVGYLAANNLQVSDQELRSQQWAAMIYLGPAKQQAVVDEIVERFQACIAGGDQLGTALVSQAEMAQLAQITQTFSAELSQYPVLIDWASMVSDVQLRNVLLEETRVEKTYEVTPGQLLQLPSAIKRRVKESNRIQPVLVPPIGSNTQRSSGRNWAICIGINEYYNLTPLRYAVQDAVAVRDFFLQEVDFDEVFYFADDSPLIATPDGPIRSLPTYANLTYFFRKRFQQQFLNVGDNFWFFFAGHGERHKGHDYLMPIDVDPGDLERTALKISDITASLRNSGADNTVLLLDAGVGFGGEARPDIVTVYSCSPRQASYEIEELGHGVFTHALLEGLRLQGANSCATVQRIDQYLCHQVPSLNQRYKKPVQTPYTAVEPLSKSCLILLPQRARLEDVQALKIAAYQAENENDWDFAQQLWTRVLATPGVDQDAIKAIGRIALNRVKHPSSMGDSLVTTAGSRRIGAPVEELKPPTPSEPTFSFEVVTVDAKGNISRREQESAAYHREGLGQGVDLDLVLIPGGTFQMGSAVGQGQERERPQHNVAVKPFLMGRYPVTQSQWRVVAALPKIARDLEADPSHFKGNSRPVEQVNWDDAMEFCQRLSKHTKREYRLPSEAEWEYACRAGTTTPFYFGETITTDIANYRGTDWLYEGKTYPGNYGSGPYGEYREKTTDVGIFPANAFGLHDMHGNVWEWCQDHWHENYGGLFSRKAPTDGSAWLSSNEDETRLLRGGSWVFNPDSCRSANRFWFARDYRDFIVGFRVVCVSS